MKYLIRLLIASSLFVSQGSYAAPMIYTFEGTVDGFQSYHSGYSINDFDIEVGKTTLKYVFEIDFEANNSTYTNSAGTWNYFHSTLLEGAVINDGNVYGDSRGFNLDRVSGSNLGQITSSMSSVRINTHEGDTPDWMVQDWSVGQSFRSLDSACFSGGEGGCAVYAFGDVMLTSIVTAKVSEPSTLILMVLALSFLLARRRT